MFKTARIKLTAWYLLIIMVISLFFSAAIYQMASLEIQRFARAPRFRMEERIELDEKLITEAKNRLFLSLLKINGAILVISGTLGYLLAGKTLKPISLMMEEQTRFVADVSHELRTPLTALMLDFEVALRDKKIRLSEAKKVLNNGIEESQKLKKLTDSLLELVNNKNETKNKEKIKIKKIIDEAVKKIKIKAIKKKIKIIKKINGAEIVGVREKLEEAILILLDNAVKYGKTGGFVNITAKQFDKKVTIEIEDNGIGINEKDLPFIFNRFYRADNARSKNGEGGYGLGLPIAKKIVEESGGKIEVKSEIGKGSKFKLIYPG